MNIIQRYKKIFCTLQYVRMVVFLVYCIVIHVFPSHAVSAATGLKMPEKFIVHFYSSENNINKFNVLKTTFDSYFARFGPYEFQPYSERETFETEIKQAQGLVLVSSWHFSNIAEKYDLKPVLVGMRNGQTSQKRTLVSTQKLANPLEVLKTGRIASASSEEHTHSLLREMFQHYEAIDSIRIFPVPKDIDALLAVGYGLAQSALVTENALENLKIANPKLYQEMALITEGENALLLILAVPEHFAEHSQQLIHVLQQMSADPEGRQSLQLLGLDDWQALNLSDELLLKE